MSSNSRAENWFVGCFLGIILLLIFGAIAFEITRIILIFEFFKWLLNL